MDNGMCRANISNNSIQCLFKKHFRSAKNKYIPIPP